MIHIHDIFLPAEYPEAWLRQRHFWNEQYLLQAFLIYNQHFEILWGQRYAELRYPEVYAQAFSGRISEAENHCSYSFWLRRRLA